MRAEVAEDGGEEDALEVSPLLGGGSSAEVKPARAVSVRCPALTQRIMAADQHQAAASRGRNKSVSLLFRASCAAPVANGFECG
eukprot:391194-Rhodomonas_salina.1